MWFVESTINRKLHIKTQYVFFIVRWHTHQKCITCFEDKTTYNYKQYMTGLILNSNCNKFLAKVSIKAAKDEQIRENNREKKSKKGIGIRYLVRASSEKVYEINCWKSSLYDLRKGTAAKWDLVNIANVIRKTQLFFSHMSIKIYRGKKS